MKVPSTNAISTHKSVSSYLVGQQIIIELYGCNPLIIDDIQKIERIMLQAAEASHATVVAYKFHKFSPQGVSGAVIVAESHLAIHTWPEDGYCSVDIYTCGEHTDNKTAIQVIKNAVGAKRLQTVEVNMCRFSEDSKLDKKTYSASREMLVKESHVFKERCLIRGGARKTIIFKEQLVAYKSQFQEIEVYDTVPYGKMLAINGDIMLTEYDHHGYHEMIVHVPLNAHPNPKKVLVIGGGDGGTVTELVKHNQVEEIILCEIDSKVIQICKEYFPNLTSGFNDPRVSIVIQDAAEYIKTKNQYFDVICIDSSDFFGPAEVLFRKEFYQNIQRALTPDGIAIAQCESLFYDRKFITQIYKQNKEIFSFISLYYGLIPSYSSSTHGFFFFSNKYSPWDAFDPERAAQIKGLKYYHPDMQKASFEIPQFLRQLITN